MPLFKSKKKKEDDDDDLVDVPESDIAVGSAFNGGDDFEDELKGDAETGSEGKDSESEGGTYPADCYSFISVHGPTSPYFYFGFFVWAFQVAFLILMVLRVIHPRLSTNENDDNPDAGQDNSFWAYFIPANAGNLSKATQFMALTTYCVFADESLKDIATAIETFPNFKRVKSGDNVGLIVTSCLLRLVQGVLATFVVFLLVTSTTDVIDIILNFTAVNFISAFDDVAFELAQEGKYGPALQNEADRIEELPCPPCMYRKRQHVRYALTVIPVFVTLFVSMLALTISQQSSEIWLTKTLRVQFKDDPLRGVYNGCYNETMRVSKRVLFESFEKNEEAAKFGYCQVDKKWYLYTGANEDPCEIMEEDKVAFSSKTYLFDFSSVAEETWYSRTGTPLELYFFDDNKNDLDYDECSSFLGDGSCDTVFNIFDHNYDEGDCCAATCEGLDCGVGALTTVFENNVTSGNGYPFCANPDMKPITIELNNVYVPPDNPLKGDTSGPFDRIPAIEPLMILDCDGINVLMVNIKAEMKFARETVYVSDGADCEVTVKNNTGGPLDIQYVNYTVYHGNETQVDTDRIVMFNADSFTESVHKFRRIPECYFEKLSEFVDNTTIYTGDSPSNKAVDWLLQDSEGFSNCQYDSFIERYALAAINYGAPNIAESSTDGLWLSKQRHCVWQNVECVDDFVTQLDLGSTDDLLLSGTIATEIGLLKNIDWLEFGSNDMYGTIPTEIGTWENLIYFGTDFARLSGTIPTEIGNLSKFVWLILTGNQLTGTIPTEIGQISTLEAFVVPNNKMDGTIPEEVGKLSLMEYFFVGTNTFTGTIPSLFGTMPRLLYLSAMANEFSGTIPSEIAQAPALQYIQLDDNILTGSIPMELFNRTYIEFQFFGNPLSDLVLLEGKEICETDGGEIYCDCSSDCSFRPFQCECDAAQSCCQDFLEQFTPCVVCPTDGLGNPTFWVEEYITDCQGIAFYLENSLVEFGDEEKCYGGKLFFDSIGCTCSSPDDAVSLTPDPVLGDSVDV
eukprot:CAMPEP_0116156516 /NCGR_PEP_ID=MMETSP0329-20121206/22873_1 /TAXON_ID=697910 /ORGANISM="Pseudo-nitzschia arenysensis, Strain B593" /LENGTH=1018 /DNA_ID=CAMNT_0003653603 /DNA_START=73 /DNA_END=3129 /DNA_ORIENTATION=-